MVKELEIRCLKPRSPFDDLSNEPMINQITFELHNYHAWTDGLYIFPDIYSKKGGVNMVVEVIDKKVINVYKNKLYETS